MSEKITEQKKETESFNYQAMLDLWSKENWEKFMSNMSDFYKKAHESTKSYFNEDFPKQKKAFVDTYFAQKAISHGASESLPFSTLALLGEKLSQSAYRDEVQSIIKANIVKFKGEYLKLDDFENQSKIQKALKTYQFHECQEIEKAA